MIKKLKLDISSLIGTPPRLFNSRIKYLPSRKGERYASALSGMSLNNKVYKNLGKVQLKDYISEFIKKHT